MKAAAGWRGTGGPAHLARRFFSSLSPTGPSARDERWVGRVLSAHELALWERMTNADRRHAVGVARRVEAALGPGGNHAALAAALLHDVGKVESGLGTGGRVVATVLAVVFGREGVAARWRERSGIEGGIARYLDHDRIGVQLLSAAGSKPVVVAWARDHHLPPERWSTPPDLGRVLKKADDL